MNKITVIIPTYNRYDSVLPLSLMSIISQSRLPNRVILIDDSPIKKFYDYPTLKSILRLFKEKEVEFDYFHGQSKGMCPALQIGLDDVEDGWVLKMDDDHILEWNTIELLEKNINDKVGAISGLILEKDKKFISKPTKVDGIYNKIENIYTESGIQMLKEQDNTLKNVEHIYSLYFFNRKLSDDYPIELQPSGNREDTIFTHRIYRKGYDLIIDPNIKIYHISTTLADYLYDKNNLEWFFINNMLTEWGIVPDKLKFRKNDKQIIMTKNNIDYIVKL
jgi:glycosyltransferase involved in cell wall biosynthesis